MADDATSRLFAGDRRELARAITLVESRLPADRIAARALLAQAAPRAGRALRIGISGPPGAGKSTLIEALGLQALAQGRRIAVLAIDPSSTLTGGSVLGDKTRMAELATRDDAFVRPTPSAGALGGVAAGTREAILLCEAAGYDVVILETVGVGQSEVTAASLTDLFVVLSLPNAGDDLQAMKRGVLEHADVLVVNKADLDRDAAERAARQLDGAGRGSVCCVSAATGEGVPALWSLLHDCWQARSADGTLARRRAAQALEALWSGLSDQLLDDLRASAAVAAALPSLQARVADGSIPPRDAAAQLLALYRRDGAT